MKKGQTFIGIGVPRAGTTWMYNLLDSHEGIYMSPKKEVNYFDMNYDKGRKWYKQFFRKKREKHTHAGEFSPQYIFRPQVIRRIKQYGRIKKFIIIFRDPIDRVLSDYRRSIIQDGYSKSFESFIDDYPEVAESYLYGKSLERWFNAFERDRFLILMYENAFDDLESTVDRLASFLEVSSSRFHKKSIDKKINSAQVPAKVKIFTGIKKITSAAQSVGAGPLINLLKSIGFTKRLYKRIFGVLSSNQVFRKHDKYLAKKIFKKDTKKLQKVLDRPVPWA